MRERKAGARENEKTKVHRWEVEGKARWKKDREEVDGGRLRWKGGGSRRVEDGWVAASKGCLDGSTGARGESGVG